MIPDSIRAIPAQTAPEEQQYLIWLAERVYRGKGQLIELGTLLGASSASLAEGFKRARRRDKFIAMDYFKWWGDALRPDGVADGESFQAYYEANIRDYAQFIDVRCVNLVEATYDEGPIEILFVDAAKNWGLLNATLRVFGPHLMPGETRVLFQDFRYLEYWLVLVMDHYPELWEEIECTESGYTNTFRPRSAEALRWCAEVDFSDDDFSWEVARNIFHRRIGSSSVAQAEQYRLAAITKALVEQEFEACAELCAHAPGSKSWSAMLPKAAQRGAVLLRRRLMHGSEAWRGRESIESLQRRRANIATLPAVFEEPLTEVYDLAIAKWQADAKQK